MMAWAKKVAVSLLKLLLVEENRKEDVCYAETG